MNRANFSGTLFYMQRALSARNDIELTILGEDFYRKKRRPSTSRKIIRKMLALIPGTRERLLRRDQTLHLRSIRKDIQDGNHDCIIAPVASQLVADLPQSVIANTPIVFVTDATPSFIVQEYGWTIGDQAITKEAFCIERSQKVIYSSAYMAERAKMEFSMQLAGIEDKIDVVPFGLNLDALPSVPSAKNLDGKIELLFVARFWERKGGNIAVDCMNTLADMGIDAHLTIVGIEPPEAVPTNVSVIPFLNKNSAADQQHYVQLLENAHFLILPTQADCTPMVIAEANAYGVPVLTTNVGGIPSLVENGANGFMFEPQAAGSLYAEKIASIRHSAEHYLDLSRKSRGQFDKRLNWEAWAGAMSMIFHEISGRDAS